MNKVHFIIIQYFGSRAAKVAAKTFVKYLLQKGQGSIYLSPRNRIEVEKENYSAKIENEQVVITKLNGIKVNKRFPFSTIFNDVVLEDLVLK